MEIILVKQTDALLSEQDAAAVRRFLFEYLDGCTEKDQRGWRRFVRALHESGSGEFFSIKTENRRSGPFHRLHMAVTSAVFKTQERIADFEQFRLWTKVGAGWVTWMAGPKGGVYPVPRSISYDKCEEGEMREFHQLCIAFFRTEHAQKYLWASLSPTAADQAMTEILNQFER